MKGIENIQGERREVREIREWMRKRETGRERNNWIFYLFEMQT